MNRNQIIVLSLVVFLLGDAEGTIRTNWHYRNQKKKMDHNSMVQQLKIDALVEFGKDIAEGMDREKAFKKLNDQKDFIDIVE